MDLATLTAAPTTVTVGGRDFRIGPLRFLELGVFQRFLADQFREQGRGKPPSVGFDAAWPEALMESQEGIVFFLNVLFSRHQAFTDDDLSHVLAHLGPVHMKHLWRVALELPEEEPPGPKAGDAA